MPVDSPHPDYDPNAGAWQRARDGFEGEDDIKLGESNTVGFCITVNSGKFRQVILQIQQTASTGRHFIQTKQTGTQAAK